MAGSFSQFFLDLYKSNPKWNFIYFYDPVQADRVIEGFWTTLELAVIWSGFAISKNEMPFVAQTVIMGGNPRVGLEDNLYLSKGKLASNAQLVEKAIRIVNDLGVSPMTPAETREKLKLKNYK